MKIEDTSTTKREFWNIIKEHYVVMFILVDDNCDPEALKNLRDNALLVSTPCIEMNVKKFMDYTDNVPEKDTTPIFTVQCGDRIPELLYGYDYESVMPIMQWSNQAYSDVLRKKAEGRRF